MSTDFDQMNTAQLTELAQQAHHYLEVGELPDNDADLMKAAMEALMEKLSHQLMVEG